MKARRWLLAGAAAGLALAGWSRRSGARAKALVPPDGRFVEVDGARLHVVELGRGPPIVMVHGLAGQLRNFTMRLAALLADRHRLVVIDRPGAGWSLAAPGPTPGIEAQALLVGRLIDTLRLERPLVVGHSYGGAVALALAIARPELVRGLALIAPLTQPQRRAPRWFRVAAGGTRVTRLVASHLFVLPAVQLLRRHTQRNVFAPEPVTPDFAVEGGIALALRPEAMAAGWYEAAVLDDELARIVPHYPALTLPVGILFGHGDRILDPECDGAGTTALLPDATLELVDGGHMLPVTQPALVARFIESVAARAR